MGWKVVDEYVQSEVASDEEDQKRIHRGEKGENRSRQEGEATVSIQDQIYSPVGTPASATITHPAQQSQQQQRYLGSCFSCGKSGQWKFECPNVKHNVK